MVVEAEGCLMSHKSQIVNSVMRASSPQIVNWWPRGQCEIKGFSTSYPGLNHLMLVLPLLLLVLAVANLARKCKVWRIACRCHLSWMTFSAMLIKHVKRSIIGHRRNLKHFIWKELDKNFLSAKAKYANERWAFQVGWNLPVLLWRLFGVRVKIRTICGWNLLVMIVTFLYRDCLLKEGLVFV